MPERRLTLVPNVYGTFEWLALAEIVLNFSAFRSVLRRLKGQREAGGEDLPASRANSSHANFFCFGELGRLLAAAGIAVDRYRACTVLRSNLVDSLIRHFRLVTWNARFAEHLPAWCASDPIFEPRGGQPASATQSQREAWAIWRKRPNDCRWGIT
jgi:hypothetical protein